MSYDYKAGKKRINDILNSPNDIEEKDNVPNGDNFDYQGGIYAPVAAIFVDIRDSSTYFTKQPKKQVAKMIRSFVSELVEIFRKNENYREIGIRGDCVYAIYNAPNKDALKTVINDASMSNTLMKMLNVLLDKKGFKTIKVGIGVGYDEKQLVIKAGRKGTGISDFIWIGNAVIDASNCCSYGNSTSIRKSVIISSDFYEKIKDLNANDDEKYKDLFTSFWGSGKQMYECEIVSIGFNNWINDGMKD